MKTPLQTCCSAVTVTVLLVVLSSVHVAYAQSLNGQAGPVAYPSPIRFDAPAADSVVTPPTAFQDHSSWVDIMPTSVIEDEVWMKSPVELANYSNSSEPLPIKPISFQVGNIEVVPYGVLWSDMIYTTSRQSHRQFILFIQSEETQGEDAFELESRYTRVGVNLKGPKVDMLGGLTSGGQVEVDFLGGFITENQPDTRLRHAYWEAKNEYVRFLAGQYWDLTSPLLPHTVNFSVNWGAGNIGFRRAQFRVERYLHLSDNLLWTLQGAAASEVIQDFGTAEDIGRESPNWPMIQARTAVTFGEGGCRPITIGVSGHVGETGFDFKDGHPANPALGPQDDARFDTWSFNTDVRVPVTDRLGFHGEFFTGANLSPLLGGIVQGVCPCLRIPIRSTGGWAELWYEITPCLQANVGFGIDDPNNQDSLIGRTYNRVAYGNIFLDITEHLITGFEVSSWRTSYHNRTSEPGYNPISAPTLPGEAIALDWTVRYKF